MIINGNNNAMTDSGSNTKSLPKDAHVIVAILKDMGVSDYEPRLINQLLEFSYRYVVTILEDSKVLSNHAKKKNIDIDDVKLAVQMFTDQNFTTPPSRDILLEMARTKNATTLPIPKPSSGAMKLPPDRHCITACNYRLKSKLKAKTGGHVVMNANYSGHGGGYAQPSKINLGGGNKSSQMIQQQQTLNLANSPSVITVNPKFQMSSTEGGSATTPNTASSAANPPVFKIQVAPGIQLGNNKRKREDEEN